MHSYIGHIYTVEMRIKGWLDSLVLASAANEPAHGYGIAATLRSQGVGELADASLYPVLKKLEAEGLLHSDWDTTGPGPARKVYAITELGNVRLASDIDDWKAVRRGVDSVFASVDKARADR